MLQISSTRKQLLTIIGITASIVVLTNLPFLPGPKILNTPAQFLYNCGLLFGIISIPFIPFALFLTVKHFINQRGNFRYTYLLVLVVPLTLFSTFFISNHLRGFSRAFAIEKAESLIKEIDDFKNINGYYPGNLTNLQEKSYPSGIIGIGDFQYQNTGLGYEIIFTQNVIFNFNFEIVTYNKSDKHSIKGEAMELYETGYSHWKYEIFD